MRLNGRRESSNVEDRRRRGSGAKIAGVGGIGSLIIAAIIVWLSGGDPVSVLNQGSGFATAEQIRGGYEPTAQEEEYASFAKKILAGTEDVWSEEFKRLGLTYRPPKMVLYSGSVQSTHFDRSQRCRIEGKKSDLIDFVLKEKHTGKRRLLLAIIEKMPIYNKEEVRGDFIDFCLSKINSDEPYGVRALCMKLAFAQCRFFPELINELESELEMMEQEQLSPGLLAAKRNVMRHLVNIK